MSEEKKKGRALKAFNDAGTGQNFEADEVYDFPAGAYANYLAAGLITNVPAAKAEKADNAAKDTAVGKAA